MNERPNRGWIVIWIALLLALACTIPNAASETTPTPGLSAQDIASTSVAQTLTALAPRATSDASQPPPAGQPTLTVPPPISDTATQCLPSVTANSNVNVRSGPSMDYDIVGQLPAGSSALVFGQNSDRTWWYIEFPNGSGQYAWVAASVTSATCIPATLQIVAAPPLPTPVP
ncbi:MAG: SH3 domain-containing protein, partial [Chloroflexota bacterium]